MHYMVVGSLLAILGFQVAALGVYGRMYALSIGLLNRDRFILWGMRYLTLERGLIGGSAALFTGFGLLLWILARWISRDFGFFESYGMLRPALLGMTLVVIGVQTIFSSFFLSLLSMRFEKPSDD